MEKNLIEWKHPKYKVTSFDDVKKYIKIFASSVPCSGPNPCTGGGGSGGCSCAAHCDLLAGGFYCYDFFIHIDF